MTGSTFLYFFSLELGVHVAAAAGTSGVAAVNIYSPQTETETPDFFQVREEKTRQLRDLDWFWQDVVKWKNSASKLSRNKDGELVCLARTDAGRHGEYIGCSAVLAAADSQESTGCGSYCQPARRPGCWNLAIRARATGLRAAERSLGRVARVLQSRDM